MSVCKRKHVDYSKNELAHIVFQRMSQILMREGWCEGCYLDIQQPCGYTHSLKYHTCLDIRDNYAKHPQACCELYKEEQFTVGEFFRSLRESEKRSLYHDYRHNKLSDGSYIDPLTFLKFQIEATSKNFEFPDKYVSTSDSC